MINIYKQNLEKTQQIIAKKCQEIGRNPSEIEIVCASKYHDLDTIKLIKETTGIMTYAENKAQSLVDKYDPSINWDFIGQLQTNKVKYIIDKTRYIQSVDRLELAVEIDRQAAKHNITANVFLEVNSGKEENKGGLWVEDVPKFYDKLKSFTNLNIKGIMAVAPIASEDILRDCFGSVEKLFLSIKNDTLNVLSMGMSNDYWLALEYGSTMIRLGRTLFM